MPHLNDLNPLSQVSAIVLPETGNASEVNTNLPYKIYSDPSSEFYSTEFLTGCANQVAFTYKKLGADVLDVELREYNVYSNYEESVLEYSHILNLHQAQNVLGRSLGSATGTFDSSGVLLSSSFKTSLSGSHANLKFPKFRLDYANDIAKESAAQAGFGANLQEYSASFASVIDQQTYDLQQTIENLALSGTFGSYANIVGKRIKITKVFYAKPSAPWRFFGQLGGFGMGMGNAFGSMMGGSSGAGYGGSGGGVWDEQNLIPVWENVAQMQAFNLALQVRTNNYSYEIVGNKIKLFPTPRLYSPSNFYFKFTLEHDQVWSDPINEDGVRFESGVEGVNNISTLPFEIIPFNNINAIGKTWIRNFAFALSLETLGRVRSKFSPLPIPNGEINLDGKDLLSEAKEKQINLRKELIDILDKMTYNELAKKDAEILDSNLSVMQKIPNLIFIG